MAETVTHEGTIIDINETSIKVKLLVLSACASCHAKNMCGAADQKDKIVDVPLQTAYYSYKIGDGVIVATQSRNALLAVFWAYLFPSILLTSILIFSISYFQSEILPILLGLLSVIVYYLILYRFRKTLQRKFIFVISRKVE